MCTYCRHVVSYIVSQYGKNQALNYLQSLEKEFVLIADQPNIGHKRNNIPTHCKCIHSQAPCNYYTPATNPINIVRILYSSKHFIEQAYN